MMTWCAQSHLDQPQMPMPLHYDNGPASCNQGDTMSGTVQQETLQGQLVLTMRLYMEGDSIRVVLERPCVGTCWYCRCQCSSRVLPVAASKMASLSGCKCCCQRHDMPHVHLHVAMLHPCRGQRLSAHSC